ncbi:hypothetical protein P4O66_011020, partial [Electrophorus voltai]
MTEVSRFSKNAVTCCNTEAFGLNKEIADSFQSPGECHGPAICQHGSYLVHQIFLSWNSLKKMSASVLSSIYDFDLFYRQEKTQSSNAIHLNNMLDKRTIGIPLATSNTNNNRSNATGYFRSNSASHMDSISGSKFQGWISTADGIHGLGVCAWCDGLYLPAQGKEVPPSSSSSSSAVQVQRALSEHFLPQETITKGLGHLGTLCGALTVSCHYSPGFSRQRRSMLAHLSPRLLKSEAVTSVLAASVLYLAKLDVCPAPSAQITHGSGTSRQPKAGSLTWSLHSCSDLSDCADGQAMTME